MTPQCNLPEGFAAGAAVEVQSVISRLAEGLTILFAMGDAERKAPGRNRRWSRAGSPENRMGAETAGVYRWVSGQAARPGTLTSE